MNKIKPEYVINRLLKAGVPEPNHYEYLQYSQSYVFYWEYKADDGENKLIAFWVNSEGNAYYSVSNAICSEILPPLEAVESFAEDFKKA